MQVVWQCGDMAVLTDWEGVLEPCGAAGATRACEFVFCGPSSFEVDATA